MNGRGAPAPGAPPPPVSTTGMPLLEGKHALIKAHWNHDFPL